MIDFTPDPDVAMDNLWEWVDRWAASLESLTDEQLDVPGYGQYPYGSGSADPVHRDHPLDEP